VIKLKRAACVPDGMPGCRGSSWAVPISWMIVLRAGVDQQEEYVASDREAPHGAWPLVAAYFGTRGLRRPDTSNSVTGAKTPCPVEISDLKTP